MVTRLPGSELPEIREDEARFAAMIEQHVQAVANKFSRNLGEVLVARADPDAVSPADVNGIIAEWQRRLNESIMPWLEGFVGANVVAQVAGINATLGAQVIAAIDEELITRLILGGAENRLVAIGNDLWQAARTALAEGVGAGESIPKLAARVRDAADVAAPRATRIARTEVVGASNKSSIEVVRASGVVAQKEWIATFDQRVRLTHIAAHAQVVNLDDSFRVGAASLDHPGDFKGPAEEIINCRCAMGYVVDEDAEDDPLTAAARDHSDGAMIALVPTEEDAARLAIDDGELESELHLTLAYLGDASDWTDKQRDSLINSFVSRQYPGKINADAFGLAHWNPFGDNSCWVLNVGGADINEAKEVVWDALLDNDGLPELAEQHKPFAAHVCLTYTDDTSLALIEALKDRLGSVTFDRIRVAFAGDHFDIPLYGTLSTE